MARKILSLLLISSLSASAQAEPLNFKQLYVGFNGPKAPATFVFTSQESANSSWLGPALGEQAKLVLSQVDFSHQVLVAAAVGERSTNTGNVSIQLIEAHQSIVTPYVRLGVNSPECIEPKRPSYPFVLAVIEKLEGLRPVTGYDHQNFPDGCKPVPSGAPVSPSPVQP